ncbi:hypothetical protein A7982_12899 [Minicystis rosea]|nr:hypothetical protein A7982_12899 [Minicystis rosea]
MCIEQLTTEVTLTGDGSSTAPVPDILCDAEGNVGNQTILETKEQSTKMGFGVPVGAGFRLGPGELTGELLFESGKVDHAAIGDSCTAAFANLPIGYRFLL